MIFDARLIDQAVVDEIGYKFSLYHDFSSLLIEYPYYNRNELFSILYLFNPNDIYLTEYLTCETIEDSKIIVFSDTHISSIKQNIDYLADLYEFARSNNINRLFHCGDVLHSSSKTSKPELRDYTKKAKYFNEIMDMINDNSSLKTSIILGNHDFEIFSRRPEALNIISSRNDINIFGFKKAYINWCNYMFSFQHDIRSYKVNFPFKNEMIEFRGHSHFCRKIEPTEFKSLRINVPSTSDVSINYMEKPPKKDEITPGFLVCEIKDNKVTVIEYIYSKGGIYEYRTICSEKLNDNFKIKSIKKTF